jgi:hypothetical protein
MTRLALRQTLKLDDFLGAAGRFFEFNLQVVTKIVAAPGA